MTNFNTYDYDFLAKCLSDGSIAFKGESIKRLTVLAQNDKKQFLANSKTVLNMMEELYNEERDDLNIQCTLLLSQIVLNLISKQNQLTIKARHLKHLVVNLGHPSKPSIRKASHTCLLAYIKTYHNFDFLLEEYLDAGFENESILVKQKSINSLQSIFISEVKNFTWASDPSRKLLQTMIMKAGDENLQIAKAATQCLLSLCKYPGIKETAELISIGYVHKFIDFLATTTSKLPNIDISITVEDLSKILENLRSKPKPEPKAEKKTEVKEIVKESKGEKEKDKLESAFKTVETPSQSLTYQRRLEKIKKAMATTSEKKIEKDTPGTLNFVKILNNISNEGSLKERTEAVEDLLFKIQSNKNKPQFEASIKLILPNILKMLKDSNPKIVGLTLRIIENIVHEIKSTDPQLQVLITAIIEKLGDQKISIRQIVSKVIKELINKTEKGLWIQELLENIRRNTNTFLKDETLNLIHIIYEENEIEVINYPVEDLVKKIVEFTDDPKTKIKIRSLDCLAQIVFKSDSIQKYNEILKNEMPDVFYQMYLEKIGKLVKEKEKKLMLESERRKKNEELNNYRTTYQERPTNFSRNEQREESDEDKLNVSMDVVRKRVGHLKKRRGLLSTQETSSMDRTYRTIERNEPNVEEVDIMLPSLYKKSRTNRFDLKKKFDSPLKTFDNKGSDYLNKTDLKPLNDPEKQFKIIMEDLKSNDWKVQFETTNKFRRLVEFNPELIFSTSSSNLHNITLDILSFIESLRSSVSKNALICLNEFILALGKQVDPEMEVILEKLMKKSADTNIFISSEVQKCLKSLSVHATTSKLLEKLTAFKESKSISIKDAFINILLGMKDEDKIRTKEYGKLAETMTLFLNEAQLDLRAKAKSGIIDICKNLGDWYRMLRGKVSSGAFKVICDLMTKNPNNSSSMQMETVPLKSKKISELRTISVDSKVKNRQDSSRQTKTLIESSKTSQTPKTAFIKVSQFPNEFSEIQGLIDQSNSSQWKKRIESVQGLKLLGLKYPNQFLQYRSSCHFIDILSKQIGQPNVKVSVNAMEVFLAILDPLTKLVENNLGIVCNSIFNGLSSTKVETKEMAEKCTKTILTKIDLSIILQHVCHGILYALPKSRIHLVNQLESMVSRIHETKKQLLFKHVFPVCNKLMDEYKAQVMPHVVSLFIKMYEVMGNNMFSHLNKFKVVRELIDK